MPVVTRSQSKLMLDKQAQDEKIVESKSDLTQNTKLLYKEIEKLYKLIDNFYDIDNGKVNINTYDILISYNHPQIIVNSESYLTFKVINLITQKVSSFLW